MLKHVSVVMHYEVESVLLSSILKGIIDVLPEGAGITIDIDDGEA